MVSSMMSWANAHYLTEKIRKTGYFDVLNDAAHIPVVTFKLHEEKNFDLFDLSYKLRERISFFRPIINLQRFYFYTQFRPL